jgi:hypothetical protein
VFKSRAKEERCQHKNNRLQKMSQRRKEVINGEDWLLANSQEGEVSKEMKYHRKHLFPFSWIFLKMKYTEIMKMLVFYNSSFLFSFPSTHLNNDFHILGKPSWEYQNFDDIKIHKQR